MAVSAVSAGATPQDNPYAQVRQAFSQLSNALQSGNLTAAQSAYNTLESSPMAQNGPLAQALQQIGQDLQSGDISGAQQALAQLQQQQQAHHGHHHHGGGVKAPDQSDSARQTQPSNSSQSSSNDPDGDGDNDGGASTSTIVTNIDQTLNITV